MSDAATSRALKHYNAGAEHFRKGAFDEAVKCFQRAAEADPKFYRAWAYLGMAFAEQGQLDPAIEAYRKCIDIEPAYHKAFNNIGELYRRKGLLDYASVVFKMATEIDPKQAHYFYNLGITYFEIGMYPQAEEAFVAAHRLAPGDFDYVTELAQAQFTLKKFEAAADTLAAFLVGHPDHERAAETKARIAMLRRHAGARKPPASGAPEIPKTEIRLAPIEDDDEASQTKIADPPA